LDVGIASKAVRGECPDETPSDTHAFAQGRLSVERG